MVGARHADSIRIVPIVVARDGEDRDGARACVGAKAAAQFDAVESGYGDIGENQVGMNSEGFRECLMAVVRLIRLKTALLERRRVEKTRLWIVFDDQYQRP